MSAVRVVAERQAGEMERVVRLYFRTCDALEPISHRDLIEQMQRTEVTLLKVRLPDGFAQGHVPGARSIPLGELEQRLYELPPSPLANRVAMRWCRSP